MKDQDFYNFLKDDTWDLTREEVENLMDSELMKDPKEIDTDLVDACINYLTEADRKAELKPEVVVKTKRRPVRLKRLLIAAAAAVLALCTVITAGAANEKWNITDKIVSFFSDYATVNYSDKGPESKQSAVPHNESKLYKELEEGGIENILLPADLYTMKHKKLNWQNSEYTNCVGIKFPEDKIFVTIQTFKSENEILNHDIQGSFTNSKKITVNGIDVYLFELNGGNTDKVTTTISYQVGLTQYSIQYRHSIDESENFVKTMN